MLLAPSLSRGLTGLILACCLMLSCLGTQPAMAHEGHDHGPPPPPLPVTTKPRATMHSDAYEIVAIANGQTLTVFLDAYATNEPVVDAVIEVMAGNGSVPVLPRADGTYAALIPALANPGRQELIFTIVHPGGNDLLAGEIEVAAAAAASAAPSGKHSDGVTWPQTLPVLLALLGGIAVGYRLRAPRSATGAVLLAGALLLAPDSARAHEGHEPSPAPAADSLSGDIPRRLPDGSVFLPKPSQRLLSIRSQIAAMTEVPRAARFAGRIIADPNRAGLVQSINGGRVSAPPGGLPRLGQSVVKGQVLATITPALPLADQSTLADKQRELEGALDLARQRHSRLQRLGGTSTPRGQIEDIELEMTNLEQRLKTLIAAKVRAEVLEAPVDGIIAASRVVAGQVVQGQDVLFQIVDQNSMWVEALSFDTFEAGDIVTASAVMPDGTVLRLDYRGRSRAMQAQAIAIHFAIEAAPPKTVVGLPVTVLARRGERAKGMLLPRDAIVRGIGGDAIVWQHLDPERFVMRPVRVEPYDGTQVLVTAGIAPKDRIVVHGAELISQVR